jgi:patatin-like phospholipase/acyl hydrolase
MNYVLLFRERKSFDVGPIFDTYNQTSYMIFYEPVDRSEVAKQLFDKVMEDLELKRIKSRVVLPNFTDEDYKRLALTCCVWFSVTKSPSSPPS